MYYKMKTNLLRSRTGVLEERIAPNAQFGLDTRRNQPSTRKRTYGGTRKRHRNSRNYNSSSKKNQTKKRILGNKK